MILAWASPFKGIEDDINWHFYIIVLRQIAAAVLVRRQNLLCVCM